ncbi:unnamed protein product [Hyaloperonospora brassicae]|uniref:RxLR effector candidate protein n=1 Tax=Hyaloperonospora brassicae TaxID=162125 RepID=A0AAV0SVY4_HYABA|nr:unnamed protein product [Hyaloperonospora brassicae]
MRLYGVVLLPCAAYLTCTTGSAGAPTSPQSTSNYLAEELTDVHHDTTKRTLRAANASSGAEERALDFSRLTEGLQSLGAKPASLVKANKWHFQGTTGEEALAKLHGSNLAGKLSAPSARVEENVAGLQKLWNGLSETDMKALMKLFSIQKQKDPTGSPLMFDALSLYYGEMSVAKMLVTARSAGGFRGKAAAELLKQKAWDLVHRDTSLEKFFVTYAVKSDNTFTTEAWKLDLLAGYLKANNQYRHRKVELLDALVTGYGGVDQLAPVLMKHGPENLIASKFFTEIIKKWYKQSLSAEQVLAALKLPRADNAFDKVYVKIVDAFVDKWRQQNAAVKDVDYVKKLVVSHADDELAVITAKARAADSDEQVTTTVQEVEKQLLARAREKEDGKTIDANKIVELAGPLNGNQMGYLQSILFRYNKIKGSQAAAVRKKERKALSERERENALLLQRYLNY